MRIFMKNVECFSIIIFSLISKEYLKEKTFLLDMPLRPHTETASNSEGIKYNNNKIAVDCSGFLLTLYL